MTPTVPILYQNWKDIWASGPITFMAGNRVSLCSKTVPCPITKGILVANETRSDPWIPIDTFRLFCSEYESDYGCRGAISLDKATIKVNFTIRRRRHTNISYLLFCLRFCYAQSHEFDECRFDVSVNNCVWYLRAENPEDKMHWIEVLQSYKPLSGIGFDSVSLMRHGSIVSLQSNSLMANPNLGVGVLREKIAEMETFRDILSDQLNTLQRWVLQMLQMADGKSWKCTTF